MSREHVEVPNLQVAFNLADARHDFHHDGHRIALTLPGADRLPQGHRYNRSAPHPSLGDTENDAWHVHAWRLLGDEMVAASLEPRYVTLSCERIDPVTLPDVARDPRLLENSLRDRLMRTAEELEALHAEVMANWLDVTRWKFRQHELGRSPHDGDSSFRPPLYDADTGEEIFNGGYSITVARSSPVTREQWDAAQQALSSGVLPSLPQQYFSEGMHQARVGNIRRAVVDFAIASEVHMKEQVLRLLPSEVNPRVGDVLARTSAARFRSDLFPAHLSADENRVYESVKQLLARLFSDRNKIMHGGEVPTSIDSCRAYGAAVESLLELCPSRQDTGISTSPTR